MIEDCQVCHGVGCPECAGDEFEKEELYPEDDITDYYETETAWNKIDKEF